VSEVEVFLFSKIISVFLKPSMIRLRIGSIIIGIVTGCFLLLSFFSSLPDGKLRIIFCDVGQGDGIYVRFPDGRDMVVDGGPGKKILGCLGRHMPFWDRTIDVAILTHPEADHLNGLLAVLSRFRVPYLVRSDIENTTDGFTNLMQLMKEKKVAEKLVTAGAKIDVGGTELAVLWPTAGQIALMNPSNNVAMQQCNNASQIPCPSVLGVTTSSNLNDGSVVVYLSYGSFDALLPGDADSHVDSALIKEIPNDPDGLEVLKVPHHGSKTGMTDDFLDWIAPNNKSKTICLDNNTTMKQPARNASHIEAGGFNNLHCPLAVISVGQNSYGHPAPEIIEKLEKIGFQVMRTDKEGDIEVVSDGREWTVSQSKK
jgi:competence protein ComEC